MFVPDPPTKRAGEPEFLHHAAGNSGWGGSSYIDEVVLRDRDTDGNGSLNQRLWYLQNWRHDVVALVADNGDQREMVRYSAYGVPFGLPGGDTESDGDNDATDITQIQTWIDPTYTYDVRGDLDLDGDVDANDKSIADAAPISGLDLGRGVLSAQDSAIGYGAWSSLLSTAHYLVRKRPFAPSLGRWGNQRDPAGYTDTLNLYEGLASNPSTNTDADGALVYRIRKKSEDFVCGSWMRRWKFRLSQTPNQYGCSVLSGGMIVQIVESERVLKPCWGGTMLGLGPPSPIRACTYDFFKVKGGDRENQGFDEWRVTQAFPNKATTSDVKAALLFYCFRSIESEFIMFQLKYHKYERTNNGTNFTYRIPNPSGGPCPNPFSATPKDYGMLKRIVGWSGDCCWTPAATHTTEFPPFF